MLIYAVAIYRYDSEGHLKRAEFATKDSGFFPYDYLEKVEKKTLPNALIEGMDGNQIYHFTEKDEHHYFSYKKNDHIRVLVTRQVLSEKECSYLFYNTTQVDELADIINDPLYYSTKDGSQKKRDAIQRKLDETKIELLKVIDRVLVRGEKLEDLTGKAETLKLETDDFNREARKLNACCPYF